MAKLTDKRARSLPPGRHNDGDGLYLRVLPSGARSWVLRYKLAGKSHDMGLGPFPAVSLARAREKAAEARRLKVEGLSPLAEKRRQRVAQAKEAAVAKAQAVTFKDAAEQCVALRKPSWGSAKTAYIWEHTLTAYAFPIFGALPVREVTLEKVEEALLQPIGEEKTPLWRALPETGRRLHRQIKTVLDFAKVKKWRNGDNPAAWELVSVALQEGKVKQQRKAKHHPAMPWADVPAFFARLVAEPDLSAIAMRVIVLTATRASEALQARWPEVDLKAKLWTIPRDRMKTDHEDDKPHVIPLSQAAVEAFEAAKAFRRANDDFVFPGAKLGRPLSEAALRKLRRKLKVAQFTTHGFRSSFRDWAGDETDYERELIEFALSHAVGSDVEQAYRRSKAVNKRRGLMDAWAAHVDSQNI